MNESRSLKQRLIAAVLTLVMLTASFVGTTFAWFTDQVTSVGNKIQAGSLQVDLSHKVGNDWVSLKQNPDHKIFDYDKWEPGYTRVETLKVDNLGSLALKYRLSIEADKSTQELGRNGESLSDVIDVYVSYGESSSSSFEAIKNSDAWDHKGTLTDVMNDPASFLSGELLPYGKTLDENAADSTKVGSATVSIALHMQESAGNEYQKLSIGDIYVNLIATQWSYENDAFGDNYDEDAIFPELNIGGITVDIKTENNVVTQVATVSESGVKATVPVGVVVDSGISKLGLSVTEKPQSDANLTLNDGEALRSLDVHMAGVSANNTVPMLITVEKAMKIGLNIGNYTLYHVEDGISNAMTSVNSLSDLDAHNEFYYDPATGDVTLSMATFSEVAFVAEVDTAWKGNRDYSWYDADETDLYIANADQLAALGAIVGGMYGNERDYFEGKTVTLLSDINLDDKNGENKELLFHPIGYYYTDDKNADGTVGDYYSTVWSFAGTFDGNGHKISNFYQNTWEIKGDYEGNYYDVAMGLFGYVADGIVKNLTVDNFSSDGEFTPTGVIAAYADNATFENIAITNCNPRVYNTGNGGIIGVAGTSSDEDNDIVLKNITVDNTNKISALWGSWDVACGGLVGMYRGNVDGNGNATGDTIHFENCHVSAQIDVNNDVCANYQYYAYRYSGMIIGSVRHNTTNDEGRTVPDMDGITATNCTVHFGTWNDYYYCELVDNTTASYTHDYQMSRLVEVKEVNGTTITYLDGTTGTVPTSGRANYVVVDYTKGHGTENATCYHFKNGEVWTHDMGGIQDGMDENGDGIDDLKEDKQHLYLEFNNLFTGYGWGVKSKGLTDYEGVTNMDITQGDHEASVEKFESDITQLENNRVYTLDKLFSLIENSGVELVPGALTVTVTNLDENNPVSATFERNNDNWAEGTISFMGTGKVQITIQDYYFCTPTTITVDIVERQPAEKFDIKLNNGEFLHRVGNKNTVSLNSLFKAKSGEEIGNVSITVEALNGSAVTGAYTSAAIWTNGTVQFSGTGVVKVTIADDDKYCKPTELILEVVDATNVTGLSGTISGNVVLLGNCGISSLTVSGRNTVYGNGFTVTYSGNGQYLNNGLKQGVITVSENGTIDNLRIIAPIYPKAYMYYGSTLLGDYVQGGPSTVDGDKTRYHYQLSAVVVKGNATISNCYIYGGRNNVFVDTGNVTIKDTILECGTVANIQIQSSSDYTVTLENITTIQYLVDSNVAGTTTQKMLGAGVLVGPETTTNPKIILNGDIKQYNWVTQEDADAASGTVAPMIVEGALGATAYNHTVNGKTATNLGIVYMNTYDVIVENNTDLPYVVGDVSMKVSGQTVNGKVCSLQNATEDQIYSDYENADRSTVNGFYQPQFTYPTDLGGQKIDKTDDGDEFLYRSGDTIYIMFVAGDTKEIDLSALVNIVKYSGQDLNLVITVKDSKGNSVPVTNGKITLSSADTYTVTYTVTDTLFYDKDGNTVSGTIEYSWDVTVDVSLKDKSIPDAYFAFDSTKQKMGYETKTVLFSTSVYQYIPFLAGLQIYDYNGQNEYVRFDGDTDYNKVAKIEVTNKYSGNNALIVVTLTDGGVIELQLLARANSGGGSTYTGSIKTSDTTIYFVNDGTTSESEKTTTAAYWYISYYKFTGNNGVTIQSGQQTFNSTGSSASTPSGSFSTTITYTVSYDANGGNCGQTTGYATSAATAVTLPTPSRSGYVFAGWYTAASGGTRVGGAGDTYTPSGDITLYAQWGKPCDVTYNANGGSCGTASDTYSGTALVLPTPTRDGYNFLGWYDAPTGGNKIGDAGATYNPTGEITLYAQWQEKVTYTVTYNANGGSCGETSKTSDTAITLPTPTRQYYTFLGWYTAASGGTRVGGAGESYLPSGNITLYAQWQAMPTYTITVSTSNATITGVTNGQTAYEGDVFSVTVSFSQTNNKTFTVKDANGNTLLSESADGTYTFTMPAGNVTISASSEKSCVTSDTLVMLADGTQKRIDEVTTDDMLLVWNFFTGDYDVVPAAIIFYHGEEEYDVVKLYFEDGTTVKVINNHGFFDVELNKFVFIDEKNAEEFIGHSFVKVDGDGRTAVRLVGYEVNKEYTGCYSIQTAVHINFMVEGMFSLTIPPIDGWFDYFEIGEDMKYDEEKMQADIEKYGLYTYEDFAEYVTYEQFMAFNGPYLKVLVGRGVLTYEQIIELIAEYVNPAQ